MKGKTTRSRIVIHCIFILLSLAYLLPMILILSISFSSEASVTAVSGPNAGYHLIPREWSLEAYKLCLKNPTTLIQAYKVTIAESFLGTALSLVVMGMFAYPLSRSNFFLRKAMATFLVITMLFGGGQIATYIIYTRWYNLGDSFWIYVLPGMAGGVWSTMIIKTFLKGLPESLFESAQLDGASELTIFFKIAVPLSKPVFATIGFMTLVGKWNDWGTSLVYIRNPDLYTLQYVLQKILDQVEFLREMATAGSGMSSKFVLSEIPSETMRYAMCILCAGPMLVVFPFFQKYFASGLTIGAIKG